MWLWEMDNLIDNLNRNILSLHSNARERWTGFYVSGISAIQKVSALIRIIIIRLELYNYLYSNFHTQQLNNRYIVLVQIWGTCTWAFSFQATTFQKEIYFLLYYTYW